MPSGAAVFPHLAAAVVVGVGAYFEEQFGQINQNKNQRRQFETAYQQAAGAIAGLYEFAPQEEVVEPEVGENGQAPELELAKA